MSRRWFYRHSSVVRIAHILNAFALALLLMSGLQIFNAHPALYWGEQSDFERPILSISNAFTPEGRPLGITSIFGGRFVTTGVLGWSRLNGRPVPRAFPGWITIPAVQDLATGRLWHFFVAWLFVLNGTIYLGYSLVGRHFRHDLLPRAPDWRDIGRALAAPLKQHAELGNRPQYSVLQKLAYMVVTVILAPLTVLTGLALSPAIDAAMPWLIAALGGRQSARTLHFVLTWLLLFFVLVHVSMVVLAGVLGTGLLNSVRSMITGWYAVPGATVGEAAGDPTSAVQTVAASARAMEEDQ